MGLHLEETDAVIELGGDGLLLILTGRSALKSADGIAVVRANVGDIGVETAAERGVSVADTGALCESRGPVVGDTALGRR